MGDTIETGLVPSFVAAADEPAGVAAFEDGPEELEQWLEHEQSCEPTVSSASSAVSAAAARKKQILAIAIALFSAVLLAAAGTALCLPSTKQTTISSVPDSFPVVASAKFRTLSHAESALSNADFDLDVMGRGRRDAQTGFVEKTFLIHDEQDWSNLEMAAAAAAEGVEGVGGGRVEVDQEHTALLTLDESNYESRDGTSAQHRRLQYSTMPLRPCYRTVDATLQTMSNITAQYPALASIETIGHSHVESEPLKILRLTNSDSPTPHSAKAPMFVIAGLHAREWAPPELVTRFAERLVSGFGIDADITWILNNVDVRLLLQSNPDSRRVAEMNNGQDQPRKNRNSANGCYYSSPSFGTDLNRNFDFKWGLDSGSSGDPCQVTYRGAYGGSESETRSIAQHSSSIFPASQRKSNPEGDGVVDQPYDDSSTEGLFVDVHAFGNDLIFPWGYQNSPVGNLDGYKAISHKISSLNGFKPSGSGYNFLGKTSGDTLDYHYGALGVPAILFELGSSWYESCAAFEGGILESNIEALLYSAKLAPGPFRLSKGPDVVDLQVSAAVGGIDAVLITARASDSEMTELSCNGCDDLDTGRQNIQSVALYVDASTAPLSMAATDGNFNSPTENVTYTLDATLHAPGRHTVCLEATDSDGYVGPKTCRYFEVVNRCSGMQTEGACTGHASCRWKVNKAKCVDVCQGVSKEDNCDASLCRWGAVEGGAEAKCHRIPW